MNMALEAECRASLFQEQSVVAYLLAFLTSLENETQLSFLLSWSSAGLRAMHGGDV